MTSIGVPLPTEEVTPATLAWLERLVGFDTVSAHSNLALIDAVQAEADEHGLGYEITHDDSAQKANILISLPASDGTTSAGVVLSGHTDVVPAPPSGWTSDPFLLTRRDDRLYGRGTADMKGFLAVVLGALPMFAAVRRRQALHIALSYDEEVGCFGVPALLDGLLAKHGAQSICIIGEPTSMTVTMGHKAVVMLRITFRGRAAHSSTTNDGVNAVEYAARATAAIRDIADGYRTNGPFDPSCDVPYTTVSVNVVSGGSAANIVAEHCEIVCEIRTIPGQQAGDVIAEVAGVAEAIEQRMRRESAESTVTVDQLALIPALDAPVDSIAAAYSRALGALPGDLKVSFGTEGGFFAGTGISTVVCGPGDMAQAHRPDEYIEVSQLVECERFMRALATDLGRDDSGGGMG